MLMQINGSWRGASDGETILVTNPVDGTVIDTVPSATYQDVSEAIAASLEGQRAWNAIAQFVVPRSIPMLNFGPAIFRELEVNALEGAIEVSARVCRILPAVVGYRS